MSAGGTERFEKLVAMLDSNQPGERETALTMIHARRVQHGWPKFVDLLRPFTDTVPLAQYQKLETDLAQWIALADRLTRENQILRAALNLPMLLKRAGIAAGAVLLVLGGCSVLRPSGVLTLPTGVTDDAFSLATLSDMSPWRRWAFDNLRENNSWSSPWVGMIAGQNFWVIIKRDSDSKTYADNNGRPIMRRCLHYFVADAKYDSAISPPLYFTPHPYNFFGHMKWPEVASFCE